MKHLSPAPNLREALAGAIEEIRSRLDDSTASILVITPSATNAALARQQLMLHGPYIRVDFTEPDGLIRDLARLPMLLAHQHLEPPGWLETTLALQLPKLAEQHRLHGYEATLLQPGWVSTLARAIHRLEQADISVSDLQNLTESSRRDILCTLLAEVAAQRTKAGFVRPISLYQHAESALVQPLPINRHQGAIIVGDRTLAPGTFRVLTRWMQDRQVIRIAPGPLPNLPQAPRGMQQAVRDADFLPLQPTKTSYQASLQLRLFKPPTPKPAPDDSVLICRTPDEVRELAEAVREVLDQVQEGTPLDQIAIVLPDTHLVNTLADLLRRA
ncbi:MAG: hypothetical protein HN348_36005, partial [Proteobacteria bacterium]|nr:hypothetical protein [Pseudomonadota bacterium]